VRVGCQPGHNEAQDANDGHLGRQRAVTRLNALTSCLQQDQFDRKQASRLRFLSLRLMLALHDMPCTMQINYKSELSSHSCQYATVKNVNNIFQKKNPTLARRQTRQPSQYCLYGRRPLQSLRKRGTFGRWIAASGGAARTCWVPGDQGAAAEPSTAC
jgi:hypothetical protein